MQGATQQTTDARSPTGHRQSGEQGAPDELLIIAGRVADTRLPLGPFLGVDLYHGNGAESAKAMLRGHIYQRLINSIDSAFQLQIHLEKYPEIAEELGFDEVPNHRTFNRSWRVQFDDNVRQNVLSTVQSHKRFFAGVSYPGIRQAIFGEPERDLAPSLSEQEKKRAYDRLQPVVRDIVEFGRSEDAVYPEADLIDYAGYISRRNTYAEQGVDRFKAENGKDEMFTPQTWRNAVLGKERQWAAANTAKSQPLDPEVEPEELDWSLDPTDRDFGGSENWHSTQEKGIEEIVTLLQSDGMLDRPVDICIDGTIRDYHKQGTEAPPGVHYSAHLPQYYGWEDLTLTAIYKGRAIVLASFSFVPEDDLFQAVRYLLDRADDLIHIRNVYADSEFGNTAILRYLSHKGMDYVIRKSNTDPVKEELDSYTGTADYTRNHPVMEEGRASVHNTTLIAVEKRTSEGNENPEDEDVPEDQSTFSDYSEPEDKQLTFAEIDDIDREYVAFVTNKSVESTGIDPDLNPIKHDDSKTVWGLANKYRRRWSIETAFRQIKNQFLANSNSRDLGMRRFLFMMAMLLYNMWACVNLLLQFHVDHVDDDTPPVRANVFLEEFANIEYG